VTRIRNVSGRGATEIHVTYTAVPHATSIAHVIAFRCRYLRTARIVSGIGGNVRSPYVYGITCRGAAYVRDFLANRVGGFRVRIANVRWVQSTPQGTARIDAISETGVVLQTYYRWRKFYGGRGRDQVKELKRLQKENERLRWAESNLTLDKLILTEAARGNF